MNIDKKIKNSNFIADFGFVKDYKSSSDLKKKNIKSFFLLNLNKDLNLENFHKK